MRDDVDVIVLMITDPCSPFMIGDNEVAMVAKETEKPPSISYNMQTDSDVSSSGTNIIISCRVIFIFWCLNR